jgi:hypothetical protein
MVLPGGIYAHGLKGAKLPAVRRAAEKKSDKPNQ